MSATAIKTASTEPKGFNVFIGHNFGNRIFTLLIPMYEFYQRSELVPHRELDESRVKDLAIYILKGAMSAVLKANGKESLPNAQPYYALKPFVVNVRECEPNGTDIKGFRLTPADESMKSSDFKVFLENKHKFTIIDGQHRQEAIGLMISALEKVIESGEEDKILVDLDVGRVEKEFWIECLNFIKKDSTVSLEVHLGLTEEEEGALFFNLNRYKKS